MAQNSQEAEEGTGCVKLSSDLCADTVAQQHMHFLHMQQQPTQV